MSFYQLSHFPSQRLDSIWLKLEKVSVSKQKSLKYELNSNLNELFRHICERYFLKHWLKLCI